MVRRLRCLRCAVAFHAYAPEDVVCLRCLRRLARAEARSGS
jgi:hypothetical protein